MQDLPRGVRILVFVGYGSVIALLVATALIWYFRTSGSPPLPVGLATAFSSLWFVVGWALVLTGASDCRTPVFLLIFCLLSLEIFFLSVAVSSAENVVYLVLVVLLIAVVTIIHQRSYGSHYLLDLPLIEFFSWSAALLGSIIVLRVFVTPDGDMTFAGAFTGALLPLMLLLYLFWMAAALPTVDLGVNLARSAVLGVRRKLPEGIFRKLSLTLLLVQGVVWVVWAVWVIWGDTNTHWLSYWVIMNGVVTVPFTLVVGVLLRVSARRWTLRAATTLLALGLALPMILLPEALIFSEVTGERSRHPYY
jgi:hypothetical protein